MTEMMTAALPDAAARPTDERARPLTSAEMTAAKVIGAAVGLLGLGGFVNSFANVTAAARPSFHALAWTLPAVIDLGIAVFSGVDLLLARLNMRKWWVRLIPWALVVTTVYLNVAHESTWFGRVAHAALPALWALAVEVATHVVRERAHLSSAKHMDAIRTARWLLAPASTVSLWRRMVLWEIRSYPDALDRERARVLDRCDLADRYGSIAWRWRAPRRERALYRLGQHAPAGTTTVTVAPVMPAVPVPAVAALPAADPTPRRVTARTASKPRGRKTPAPPDVSDLLPVGRQVLAEMTATDTTLTRDSLSDALRAAGHGAGNRKVGALLARLRAEPTDPSAADAA